MAQVSAQSATAAPTREDFAKLIDESFGNSHVQEGSVVKGTVVGIEREAMHVGMDVAEKPRGHLRAARRIEARDVGPRRRRRERVGGSPNAADAAAGINAVARARFASRSNPL